MSNTSPRIGDRVKVSIHDRTEDPYSPCNRNCFTYKGLVTDLGGTTIKIATSVGREHTPIELITDSSNVTHIYPETKRSTGIDFFTLNRLSKAEDN